MLIYFFKYKTIETHARTCLPLNISAVCSVTDDEIIGFDKLVEVLAKTI